jgi:hypothetical protein
MITYKTTKTIRFWANGSVMRKRITAIEAKERRINTL